MTAKALADQIEIAMKQGEPASFRDADLKTIIIALRLVPQSEIDTRRIVQTTHDI